MCRTALLSIERRGLGGCGGSGRVELVCGARPDSRTCTSCPDPADPALTVEREACARPYKIRFHADLLPSPQTTTLTFFSLTLFLPLPPFVAMSDHSNEEKEIARAQAGHNHNGQGEIAYQKTDNYNTVDERRRAALREIDDAKFS